MSFIDLKTVESKTEGSYLGGYLFSRDSSNVRIPVHSLLAGVAGGFFGLSKALYQNLPTRYAIVSSGLGSLAMGVVYFTSNEIANGIVRRSASREQFFISNTSAGIITNIATFAVLNRNSKILLSSNLFRSIKYTWTLCVGSLLIDHIISHERKILLAGDSEQSELFKIKRQPSTGKRWSKNEEVKLLREDANVGRFGTKEAIGQIISPQQAITFETLKQQITEHQKQLDKAEQRGSK